MPNAESRSGWDRRRDQRLSEYEWVALDLFATRGFRAVTIDEIADAAGVSARTMFRYFPTKEDFLLAQPRRNNADFARRIRELPASDEPAIAVIDLLRTMYSQLPPDLDTLDLWRRAAVEAPDVSARARGERVQELMDAIADYCARSFGVDPELDARPKLIGGSVAGLELALIEMYGRSDNRPLELLDAAAPVIAQIR